MATMLRNICRFGGCNLEFASLADLILHIEEMHINSDSDVLRRQEAQQPPCVPLSYIFRVFQKIPAGKRPQPIIPEPEIYSLKPPTKKAAIYAQGRASTSVDQQDDDSQSVQSLEEDSISSTDSAHHSEETRSSVNSDATLPPTGVPSVKLSTKPSEVESKRYGCPVMGCKKRYKNLNAIKAHTKSAHGHTHAGMDNSLGFTTRGIYRCNQCGKSYKTTQGLTNHIQSHKISAVNSGQLASSSGVRGAGGVPVGLISIPASTVMNVPSSGNVTHHAYQKAGGGLVSLVPITAGNLDQSALTIAAHQIQQGGPIPFKPRVTPPATPVGPQHRAMSITRSGPATPAGTNVVVSPPATPGPFSSTPSPYSAGQNSAMNIMNKM